jgi:predicted RNA methylase
MSKPRVEVLPIEEGATPDPNNINKHTQRGGGLLENSLRKRGAFRSIASAGKDAEKPVVYAGNYTLEKAIDAGFTEVINVHVTGNQLVNVVRDDLAPGSAEAIALGLEDNEIGRASYNPDLDILAAVMADPAMQTLRDEDRILAGLVEGMGTNTEQPKPWSVADEDNFSDPNGDGIEIKAGYRLSSIWYGMTRNNEVREHMLELPQRPNVHDGATVKMKYSRTNAEETERIVKTYMRPLDIFYEMCCGWMTFSSTAKYFGYSGVGGDIWDVSLDFCRKQIEAMPGEGVVAVKYADCRNTEEPSEMFDFVHSNPPFFSLEPYGDAENDLASMGSYERWLDAMGDMGREAERILKPGGLANFVINDYRENGEIVPMHADFINSIKDKSNLFLHDFVVSEVISQALRFRKHDYERRRTVKCHEYIITFKKLGTLET